MLLWNQKATVKVKTGTSLSNASLQLSYICACTLAQTTLNLVKGRISGGSSETVRTPWSEAVLSPGVPGASFLGVSLAASGDKKSKEYVLRCACSLWKEYSHAVTLSWFVFSLSILLSPTLTLRVTFCALGSEQILGIACRNSLGFYRHGPLNIWFRLFGIHKIDNSFAFLSIIIQTREYYFFLFCPFPSRIQVESS